jgi:hypothetical protein
MAATLPASASFWKSKGGQEEDAAIRQGRDPQQAFIAALKMDG